MSVVLILFFYQAEVEQGQGFFTFGKHIFARFDWYMTHFFHFIEYFIGFGVSKEFSYNDLWWRFLCFDWLWTIFANIEAIIWVCYIRCRWWVGHYHFSSFIFVEKRSLPNFADLIFGRSSWPSPYASTFASNFWFSSVPELFLVHVLYLVFLLIIIVLVQRGNIFSERVRKSRISFVIGVKKIHATS